MEEVPLLDEEVDQVPLGPVEDPAEAEEENVWE